jgi:hypothetical protein
MCTGKTCELKRCEADGKLYSSLFNRVCIPPNCPNKC